MKLSKKRLIQLAASWEAEEAIRRKFAKTPSSTDRPITQAYFAGTAFGFEYCALQLKHYLTHPEEF